MIKMGLDVFKAAGGELLRLRRLACSKCGADNVADARVCAACMEGLYVKCAACGEENLRARARCRTCGFYLRRTLGKRLRKWAATRSGRWTLGVLIFLALAYGTVKGVQWVMQVDGGG